MNVFLSPIDPSDYTWNISQFKAGNKDSFLAHSKMVHGDLMILILGKQDETKEPGAYAIVEAYGDLQYVSDYNDRMRYRMDARCIYNSEQSPFINESDIKKFTPPILRRTIIAERNLTELLLIIIKILINKKEIT